MKRAVLWSLAGLLLVLLCAGVWARLFAGEPVFPIPGGALSGEVAAELPRDWSFANRQDYLLVESRADWLSYSQRSWFMVHEGRLHLLLPSFFGDALKLRIERDPRLRVRVAETLYDLQAAPVDDPDVLAAMVAPMLRRQFGIEIAGEVRAAERPPGDVPVEMWVYRLDDPPGPSGPSR